MAKKLNCRNWILSPLMSAACMLIIFLNASQAAILTDIRVGEYDGFTRIVFELDAPIEPVQIVPMLPGHLAMVFDSTSAELIRKIPVERSQHVKSIQIWDKKDQLSVVLTLDHENFRHESFPLKNPPRIVLDIQPLKSDQGISPAPIGAQPDIPRSADSITPGSHPDEVEGSAPPAEKMDHAATSAKTDNRASQQILRENQQTIGPTRSSGLDDRSGMIAKPPDTGKAVGPERIPAQSGRLQFFLVIALVLITIVILVLLLLMLLSKQRWTMDKSRLSTKEFLQKQDKHIASLDARIQEQLKRYDEV